MRLDVTLKRQSNIIGGIAVVAITSFLVAFALAVGGLSLESSYSSPMLGIGLDLASTTNQIDTQDSEMGENHLVPVAYKYEVGPFDTVPGEIELLDYNFPYIDKETGELKELPLCITNEMAQTWWWEVRVLGGYTPLDTEGNWPWMGISFWQDQDKDGDLDLVQGWNLEWTWQRKCDGCCSCNVWKAVPGWCNNKVCLDSNQYPNLMGGLEFYEEFLRPKDEFGNYLEKIPGKEVYVHIGLLWEGCELEEQQFAYILAQKDGLSPNPRLPI